MLIGFVDELGGVDFAAEHGATVHATQSGRISFIGRRELKFLRTRRGTSASG
jgi:hypothetical protein